MVSDNIDFTPVFNKTDKKPWHGHHVYKKILTRMVFANREDFQIDRSKWCPMAVLTVWRCHPMIPAKRNADSGFKSCGYTHEYYQNRPMLQANGTGWLSGGIRASYLFTKKKRAQEAKKAIKKFISLGQRDWVRSKGKSKPVLIPCDRSWWGSKNVDSLGMRPRHYPGSHLQLEKRETDIVVINGGDFSFTGKWRWKSSSKQRRKVEGQGTQGCCGLDKKSKIPCVEMKMGDCAIGLWKINQNPDGDQFIPASHNQSLNLQATIRLTNISYVIVKTMFGSKLFTV